MSRKKLYTITLNVMLDQSDIHALNKHLYKVLEDELEIRDCSGLQIKPYDATLNKQDIFNEKIKESNQLINNLNSIQNNCKEENKNGN